MAFNFGGSASTPGQPGGGFSFGSQAAPAFGAPATTTQATGIGLGSAFGQPASGGFGFGQAAQNTAASSSIFGANRPTLTFGQPSGAPAFGAAGASTSQPASGFGLGQTQTATPSFGGFGSTTTTPAFGQTSTAPAFGASQPAVPPNTTFGFGQQTSGAPSAFGSQQSTPAATPSFTFNQQPATSAAPTPAFPVLGSATASSVPSFGQTSLSFGQQTNPGQGSGLTFGTQPTATTSSAVPPGLSFGQPVQSGLTFGQTSQAPNSLSFGQPAATASTGLTFGQPATSNSSNLSFGTTPSATPLNSSLSFGQPAVSTAPATSAQPGFNLGQTSVANSSAPPAYSLSTPSSNSAFTLNQPSTSTPASTGGFTLGLTGSSTFPAFGQQNSGLPSFGLAASTAAALPSFNIATTSAAPTTTATGTLPPFPTTVAPVASFGAQQSTATSAAPATGFGFGVTASTSDAAKPTVAVIPATTTTVSAPTATPAAAPSFSFGTTPATSTSSSVSLPQTPATATTTLTATSGTTSTSSTVNPATSGNALTFRQLEESINKWSVDLDEQEKVFLNQARSVAAWDRLLVNNGEKIVSLSDSVNRVKKDQVRLESELDFVRAQQRELEEMLLPLEESLQQEVNNMPHDVEREHTYQLSENIDSQMRRLADDLKEIIERMNASSRQHEASADPIAKIARILNAHTDSLQWAESNCTALQRKLDDVAHALDQQRHRTLSPQELPNTHIVGFNSIDGDDRGVSGWLRSLTQNEYNEKNWKLSMAAILCEKMRAAVYEKTGFRCSAGIAGNKMLAKLACACFTVMSKENPSKQPNVWNPVITSLGVSASNFVDEKTSSKNKIDRFFTKRNGGSADNKCESPESPQDDPECEEENDDHFLSVVESDKISERKEDDTNNDEPNYEEISTIVMVEDRLPTLKENETERIVNNPIEAPKKTGGFFANRVVKKNLIPNVEPISESEGFVIEEIFPNLDEVDMDTLGLLPLAFQRKIRKAMDARGGACYVNADSLTTCEKCSKELFKEEIEEHKDYHLALELQKEVSPMPSTSSSASMSTMKKESSAKSVKRPLKDQKKKTENNSKRTRTIETFFRNPA
nr:EOG090X0EZJ [Eurycercus lamellatus]